MFIVKFDILSLYLREGIKKNFRIEITTMLLTYRLCSPTFLNYVFMLDYVQITGITSVYNMCS